VDDRRGDDVGVKLWMLGSGSNGNAVLVECDGSRLLIDCGFGTRTLAGRLKAIGVAPVSIDGCLITHEHHDHIRGAGAAAKRWGWGLYATRGTSRARELLDAPVHLFVAGTTLDFPRMRVTTTRTPHDADESVGFVIESRSTGARAGLFYDIGHVTRGIARACESLDILVLESNHDDDMLAHGPYPPFLQRRIASRVGHLSNTEASNFVRRTVKRGLNHIVLAHLSENCNHPGVALSAMREAVGKTTFKGTVSAAKQDSVVGPFMPGMERAEAPMQYSLF
jgi:phosphoribosyl 1,2-cyclic phosphodiesterase